MSEQSFKLGFIMGLLCPSEKRVDEPTEKVYNLLDFGGYYYYDDNSKITFGIGEFPLVSYQDATKNEGAKGSSMRIDLTDLPFKTGDTFEIKVKFPSTDFGSVGYDYIQLECVFGVPYTAAYLDVTYNLMNDGELDAGSPQKIENFHLEENLDSDGKIIGFTATGRLTGNMRRMSVSVYAFGSVAEETIPSRGRLIFSSYDDVRIRVYE